VKSYVNAVADLVLCEFAEFFFKNSLMMMLALTFQGETPLE
jgi:hypothetical protein